MNLIVLVCRFDYHTRSADMFSDYKVIRMLIHETMQGKTTINNMLVPLLVLHGGFWAEE